MDFYKKYKVLYFCFFFTYIFAVFLILLSSYFEVGRTFFFRYDFHPLFFILILILIFILVTFLSFNSFFFLLLFFFLSLLFYYFLINVDMDTVDPVLTFFNIKMYRFRSIDDAFYFTTMLTKDFPFYISREDFDHIFVDELPRRYIFDDVIVIVDKYYSWRDFSKYSSKKWVFFDNFFSLTKNPLSPWYDPYAILREKIQLLIDRSCYCKRNPFNPVNVILFYHSISGIFMLILCKILLKFKKKK